MDLSTLTEISSEDQQKLVTNAETLIEQSTKAVINSDETAGHGADLEGHINKRLKSLDDQRTSWVKPLNEQVKRINAGFKVLTEPLKEAKEKIHGKNVVWAREQQRIADERARKQAEEAQRVADAEAKVLRDKAEAEAKEAKRIADAEAEELRKKAAAAKRKGDAEEATRLREQAKKDKAAAEERAAEEKQRLDAEAAAIEEEGKQAAATTIATASAGAARGGLGSASSARKKWAVSIVDITLVDLKYLTVDTKSLLDALQLRKAEIDLDGKRAGVKGKSLEGYIQPRLEAWAKEQPGVEFYQEVGVAIRG